MNDWSIFETSGRLGNSQMSLLLAATGPLGTPATCFFVAGVAFDRRLRTEKAAAKVATCPTEAIQRPHQLVHYVGLSFGASSRP